MSVASMESLRHRNVGEIAVNLAGATGVFRRFGIDFCCHGSVPLDEAAKTAGIAIDVLEEALANLGTRPSAEPAQDTAAMIDHIVSRFHEVHRRQLPELIMLSRKVKQFKDDLIEHIHTENNILFPRFESSAAN